MPATYLLNGEKTAISDIIAKIDWKKVTSCMDDLTRTFRDMSYTAPEDAGGRYLRLVSIFNKLGKELLLFDMVGAYREALKDIIELDTEIDYSSRDTTSRTMVEIAQRAINAVKGGDDGLLLLKWLDSSETHSASMGHRTINGKTERCVTLRVDDLPHPYFEEFGTGNTIDNAFDDALKRLSRLHAKM